MTSRKVFQLLLVVLGTVALVAGGLGVVFGAAVIPGSPDAAPSVDSELRFFAAWYVAAAVAIFRAARNPEESRDAIRLVGAAFFLAASGRLISLVVVGRPHVQFIILMVIEFLLPIVLIPWQAAVARGQTEGGD